MEYSDQSTNDDNPFLRPSNSANTIPSLFNNQSRATSVSSTSFPLFSATGKNYGNPVLHSPESSIKSGIRNIMSPLSSIKRARTSVAGGLQSARKKSRYESHTAPIFGDRVTTTIPVRTPFGASSDYSPSESPFSSMFRIPSDLVSDVPPSTKEQSEEIKKLLAQLKEARVSAKIMERELRLKQSDYERKISRLNGQKADMMIKYEELHAEKSRLEKELESYKSTEEEVEERNNTSRAKMEEMIEKANLENQDLRQQLHETNTKLLRLEVAYNKQETDHPLEMQKLSSKASRCETMLAAANDEIEELKKLLSSRQALLSETQHRLTAAEQKLSNYKVNSFELDNVDVYKTKIKEQSSRLRSLEEANQNLNGEVKMLRMASPSLQVLKEDRDSMRAELYKMKPLYRSIADLEAENANLKKERLEWAQYFDQQTEDKSVTPSALCKEVAARRIATDALKERINNLNEHLRNKDVIISDKESQILNLSVKYDNLERQYQVAVKTWERRKALLEKNIETYRDFMASTDEEQKKINESYDTKQSERIQKLEEIIEEYQKTLDEALSNTTNSQQSDAVEAVDGGTNEALKLQVEILLNRNNELEGIIEQFKANNVLLERETGGLKEQLRILERSIIQIQNTEHEVTRKNEELDKSLDRVNAENAALRKETVQLYKQISDLERAVGSGQFNKETTRVLELKDNPESREQAIRESTLAALTNENKKLLETLQKLQAEVASAGGDRNMDETDVIPTQSYKNLETRLQGEIAEKEKMISRLKEVWKAKANEYRQAVYSLLGYRFDFLENGSVRLTSTYSENKEHSFIFTSDEDNHGTMQLIGGNENYIRSLEHLRKFWVSERGSIPCFLSALTLELFDKTPEGQSAGWIRTDT
ncbi:9243_t:CDS:10 [Paraglomus occultum]|uniref:Spindle assembly checkpoint component MAD1 n=1 Tax=Paraglomus occultum TaxID=144539 RepID=A0A9N8YYI5_9GLOM|nr:9243_t:CDS:10 [Paraglomus occultum]